MKETEVRSVLLIILGIFAAIAIAVSVWMAAQRNVSGIMLVETQISATKTARAP